MKGMLIINFFFFEKLVFYELFIMITYFHEQIQKLQC